MSPWLTLKGPGYELYELGDSIPPSEHGASLHNSTVEAVANKGTTNGYAGLDSQSKVPVANLGGAGGSATNFLRGDSTWQEIAGGGDMLKSIYDPNSDGVIALAQLDASIETTTGSQTKVNTHRDVTASIHNFDASGNAPPQAHNQSAGTITTDTLDGDRLPAMSATKKGGVPLTGTPSGLYLKDDGTWAAPTAAVNIKQTEVDFGGLPVAGASFVVTDTDVTVGSQIIGSVAYEAPTGKDLDELEMDAIDLKFAPGAGQLTIYARGLEGYLADKFKVNYLIG